MIQLNLLPDVKKEFLKAKAARRKAIALSIIVTLGSGGVLVLLGLVALGQEGAIALRTGDISRKSEELSSVNNINEYLTIQAQLAEIDGLHAGKLNTSRVMAMMPHINPAAPNTAKFSSIDLMTDSTTMIFQGGVRNVSALTTLKDTMLNANLSYTQAGENIKEPLFVTVDITEYGYNAENNQGDTAVGFVLTATYNPKLLETAATNVKVEVPNMETTQSVLASPDVTFQEGAGNLEGSNE